MIDNFIRKHIATKCIYFALPLVCLAIGMYCLIQLVFKNPKDIIGRMESSKTTTLSYAQLLPTQNQQYDFLSIFALDKGGFKVRKNG